MAYSIGEVTIIVHASAATSHAGLTLPRALRSIYAYAMIMN